MSEANTAERLRERRMQEPIDARLSYRGGPEASVTIRFRGIMRTYPGHMQLIDVLEELNRERWIIRHPTVKRIFRT